MIWEEEQKNGFPLYRVPKLTFIIIFQSPVPPQYVFWYHNHRMINYDTARGGITVDTNPGPKTQSHLVIRDAVDSDSGNYTCSASNTEPASIFVFVSEGEREISKRSCWRSVKSGSFSDPSKFLWLAFTSVMHKNFKWNVGEHIESGGTHQYHIKLYRFESVCTVTVMVGTVARFVHPP